MKRGLRVAAVPGAALLLTALLVTLSAGCAEGAAGGDTAPKTATSTAVATTASSDHEATSSLVVPVSANTDGPDWIGTTSTGTGPADLYCSVAFAAAQPKGAVYVSLFDEAGDFVDGRNGLPFKFEGLEPGKYRLGVFGGYTGYISQWYGGLPMQGHDISESRVLDVQPGQSFADFVLQPGLSIQGEVTWTQGTRLTGEIHAYDLQHRDAQRWATLLGTATGSSARFLIVGLLPGLYKLGVSFGTAFIPPQFWDGGGSFEDAPAIDLTSGDVTDIHVELGDLPTATTAATSVQ